MTRSFSCQTTTWHPGSSVPSPRIMSDTSSQPVNTGRCEPSLFLSQLNSSCRARGRGLTLPVTWALLTTRVQNGAGSELERRTQRSRGRRSVDKRRHGQTSKVISIESDKYRSLARPSLGSGQRLSVMIGASGGCAKWLPPSQHISTSH